MKVPFFRLSFSAEEKHEVLDVIERGWVTSGPKVRELEEMIKNITGAGYAAALSSGTAGLHLALETLNLQTGDEIITTPFTMAGTVQAIIHAGGRPVLADIFQENMNLNPVFVEKAVSKKTKAIVSVDMAGWPCDYERLTSVAQKYGLFLLDDAAHALGAKYRGQPVGRIADATVFSFYSTKNITTGEGGMVVSDSEDFIEKIRSLALHGMTSSGWKRYQGGSWRYDVTELGYKYNLSDLSAALGVGQLKRFEFLQKRRRELAARYLDNLAELSDFIDLPQCEGDMEHAWHLFIIKTIPRRWSISRDMLIEELEKAGVGCSVHFIPVYHFSYFKKILDYRPSDFPASENAFNRVISLPFYPDLTFEEVDYVTQTLKNLCERYT